MVPEIKSSPRPARARARGFTPHHQRNCMRGNKQNYKARRSGLLFRKFSPAVHPRPFLSSPRLPPGSSSRAPALSETSGIEKRACARFSHAPTRPRIYGVCFDTERRGGRGGGEEFGTFNLSKSKLVRPVVPGWTLDPQLFDDETSVRSVAWTSPRVS